MMIVPNYVGPSEIEGVGIFADAPIKAGQPIWLLDERFDMQLREAEIERLTEVQRKFVERYGYRHMTKPGICIVEFDNGRFMNHSDRPNTDFRDVRVGRALRNITRGEEITCDYGEFDPGYTMQSGRNFVMAK
jgi:uncharacterized protein